MTRSKHQARTVEKANLLFGLYVALGAGRSLAAVCDIAQSAGVKTSATTLEGYSADFHWQKRLAAVEAEVADAEAALTIADMNLRQAALGQAMQDAGAHTVKAIDKNKEIVDPTDAARLIDSGSKLQRLAMGEATSRSEVINDTLTAIVKDIIALFLAVNQLADRDDRTREFGTGADAIIGRHVPALEGEVEE